MLSNASYSHGSKFSKAGAEAIIGMKRDLDFAHDLPFIIIRLDTCANRTSTIYTSQYISNCSDVRLRPTVRPVCDLKVIGIGCVITVIGTVKLQIPFNDLRLVLEVDFLS